ncbi:hypothetical protein GPJ56_008928 [Histomonas meleagridis]|uniref:uncharacterized protein n=1 Tax=Histomonas meleagridis TaxID=135588 RepID=UPI00355A2709|nr:hypothetical protein GPJ56_008928 [Histomonas meleagridis]KAH0797854.1 hypothetical protein GO595_009483 [Histomonas meleagridis]
MRNKPAKWGHPVFIQGFDTGYNLLNNGEDNNPSQLLSQLQKAQSMLESALRASESAREELSSLSYENKKLKNHFEQETDLLLQENEIHNTSELKNEQVEFTKLKLEWSQERSDLLSSVEHYLLVSHDYVKKASEARATVKDQRNKILELSNKLRNKLIKSKKLRISLDESKSKVSKIENLQSEIESNEKRSKELSLEIVEQNKILKAVRVSIQAKNVINNISEQINELTSTKEKSENDLKVILNELRNLEDEEKKVKCELESAKDEFKIEQMKVFSLDSELKELKSELERVKVNTADEIKKSNELNSAVRDEKVNTAMRFLITHSGEIYKAERVQRSLAGVRRRSSPLPPLKNIEESNK